MAPSETSASYPSYPARVVRYLSERRHALKCGSLEREAYDAEVERVFERVLEDTNRGCATKILTVNALREANLCEDETAARYKTLCVGSRRGGAMIPVDDAIVTVDETVPLDKDAISLSRTMDVSREGRASDGAETDALLTNKKTRIPKTTFENTLWHSEPGRDPWAFFYDEDTHVMRELEYLTEKSRAMNERAREMAELRAGELASALAAAEAAELKGRRVELGEKNAEDVTKKNKPDESADANPNPRYDKVFDEGEVVESEKDSSRTEKERDEDAARQRAVLAATATSARRAEAAARDVARFAEALEKKYPFPGNVVTSQTLSPIERGVIASWDDVDPRRPEEAPVPVVVHWTDVGAREAQPPPARVVAAADEAAAEEPLDAPRVTPPPTREESNEASTSSDAPTLESSDAVVTAPVVSSLLSSGTLTNETLVTALVRDAIARVVEDELEKESSDAATASATASAPAARVPTVKALLVGCAYFAPRRPEMTRLRGALNDVAAIREVLASLYGLDADDPEKTRVLIDRPAKNAKTSSSFFGAFSGRRGSVVRDDGESDDWKTGLAVPPQLRNASTTVVSASRDKKEKGEKDDDDVSVASVSDETSDGVPTAQNVRAGLTWLTRDAKPGDLLFFHFSGHATQVPSLVSETGEVDGADEALCLVDTDWETLNTCVTEQDLLELFFSKAPIGVKCVMSVDAKFCGAINGSATYAADEAFVEASRKRLEAHPFFSEKRAKAHDELFGRFVPPPKTVAEEIAKRATEARKMPRENLRALQTALESRRREVRERLGNGSGALLGCDAAKGETCRETLCADGAIRGAFSEALCAALRAQAVAGGGVDADAETEPNETTRERFVSELKPLSSLAAAAAAAARHRLETAFAVGESGARAQTPIAVVACEGGERDDGGGREGVRKER